jgi:hypothetical protein
MSVKFPDIEMRCLECRQPGALLFECIKSMRLHGKAKRS